MGPNTKYGLRMTSGVFDSTANDSAMVFFLADQTWAVLDVTGAWNGSDAWAHLSVCFWGDSTTSDPRPEAVVEIDTVASLADLSLGSPIHLFRRTKYGLSASNGRWWLSRRVGADPWEILTGPMRSPSNGGLTFTYYDANDVVTTDPTLVTRIEFTLRSQSYGQVSKAGHTGGFSEDSVTTTVFLRNSS